MKNTVIIFRIIIVYCWQKNSVSGTKWFFGVWDLGLAKIILDHKHGNFIYLKENKLSSFQKYRSYNMCHISQKNQEKCS